MLVNNRILWIKFYFCNQATYADVVPYGEWVGKNCNTKERERERESVSERKIGREGER